jgi:hypothetical protein
MRSGTHGVRVSCVNLERLVRALDEVAVVAGMVLVKVSLSLLLPLWRESFGERAAMLTIRGLCRELSWPRIRALVWGRFNT